MDTVTKELTQYSYFYQVSGLQKFDSDVQAIGAEGALNLNTVAGSVGDLYLALNTGLENGEKETTELTNALKDGSITSEKLNTSLNNVMADGSNIKASIHRMEAKFDEVADNPILYLKSIVAVAGSEGLDMVKSHAIAAPLAKALIIKHFGGDRAEADAQLESLGVVDGIDGMNFGMSTLFTKDHPDEIQLTVYYKLNVSQLFKWADFEAYMCKTSRARAWLAGDDIVAPTIAAPITNPGGAGEAPVRGGAGDEAEVSDDILIDLGAAGLEVLYENYQDNTDEESEAALREIVAELNADGGATADQEEILKEWAAELGIDYAGLGVISKEDEPIDEKIQFLYDLVGEINAKGGADYDEYLTVKEWAEEYGVKYDDLGLNLLLKTEMIIGYGKDVIDAVCETARLAGRDTSLWDAEEWKKYIDAYYGSLHNNRTSFDDLNTEALKVIKDGLYENGLTEYEFLQLRVKSSIKLSPEEAAKFESIRNSIPSPDTGTKLQKVINPEYLQGYLDGSFKNYKEGKIGGCLTTVEDAACMTNPKEIYEGLNLKYEGSPFSSSDEKVYAIRFTSQDTNKENLVVPYGAGMPNPTPGEVQKYEEPFTGNGFLGSMNGMVIPEYYSDGLQMDNGAELVEIRSDGTPVIIGIYDKDEGRFLPPK